MLYFTLIKFTYLTCLWDSYHTHKYTHTSTRKHTQIRAHACKCTQMHTNHLKIKFTQTHMNTHEYTQTLGFNASTPYLFYFLYLLMRFRYMQIHVGACKYSSLHTNTHRYIQIHTTRHKQT